MSLALILNAGPAAIVPAVYAELFPTRIRTVGVGAPSSIAVAALGGTAPYLQTWLGEALGPSWFNGHVIVMLLISAVAIASVPGTRGRDLSGMHRSAPSSWWRAPVRHDDDAPGRAGRDDRPVLLRQGIPAAGSGTSRRGQRAAQRAGRWT